MTNDSFARWVDSTSCNKKKFNFKIPDIGGVEAMIEFDMTADRFGLPAGQAVWSEPLKKWVRVAPDPPLSAAVVLKDKEHVRLWFKKCEFVYRLETGKDGLSTWLKTIALEVKDDNFSEGWETLRDVVKIFYSKHSSKAKEMYDWRAQDPRNQVQVFSPADERELATAR